MTYLLDYSNLSDDEYLVIKERFESNLLKPSVMVRALVQYVLKTDFNLTGLVVKADERGKPFLSDSPYHISLSHSGAYALVSISEKETGCDIQNISKYNPKIAARFFAENEVYLLSESSDKDRLFTVLWSLKEAALKKSGEGLSGGLAKFDFSSVCEKSEFDYDFLKFTRFDIGDAVIAVCSDEYEKNLKQIDLSLLVDCFKKQLFERRLK